MSRCDTLGGVNLGVMKAVGQAVQEGQSMQWGGLSSHRRIRCIGIATWGYVERNELLINPLEGKVRRQYETIHRYQLRDKSISNLYARHPYAVVVGPFGFFLPVRTPLVRVIWILYSTTSNTHKTINNYNVWTNMHLFFQQSYNCL